MKVIAISAAALAIVGSTTTGTFFVGQSTRASAQTVTAKVDTAVSARSVRDAAHERQAITAAVRTQRHHDINVLKRTTRRLRAAYKRKMNDAYSNGRSAGYNSGEATGRAAGRVAGYNSGHVDGLVDGSDALTCSDDIDVTWLPFC